MNNSINGDWSIPDFSSISNAVSSVLEITRPVMETLQQFHEIMYPLLEVIEKNRIKIIELGQGMASALKPLCAVDKLGDAQFVWWEYLTSEDEDAIIASNNINKTLRECMIQDRFKKTNNTIDKTLECQKMNKRKRLYVQSVQAFERGQSDLAVLGFTSVFDGLLTDISKNPTSSLKPRIVAIKEKLENEELLDHEEYAVLALAITFEKTVDSFSANSDFAKQEPKCLNRHWIAHGRSTRKKTKLDCVKMINIIYGLLLIDEISSSITTNSSSNQGD